MGGDTLADGGAAEAGDSLRFTAAVAGHGQKIYPEKQKKRRMCTSLFHKDDVFIIACISLAPFLQLTPSADLFLQLTPSADCVDPLIRG